MSTPFQLSLYREAFLLTALARPSQVLTAGYVAGRIGAAFRARSLADLVALTDPDRQKAFRDSVKRLATEERSLSGGVREEADLTQVVRDVLGQHGILGAWPERDSRRLAEQLVAAALGRDA